MSTTTWAPDVSEDEGTMEQAQAAAPVSRAGAHSAVAIDATDRGAALIMAREHGADLRYCPEMGRWFVYDGTRFALDKTEEVMRRAKTIPDQLALLATATADLPTKQKFMRWSLQLQHVNRLKAMIELLRSEPGIAIATDQLDRDPWLLNVANGTVDLRTGELRAHDRADLITKLAPVAYSADAPAPEFTRFLGRIFKDDAALIEYVKRTCGYCLTGDTSEQKVQFWYGTGANGKSTLLETLAELLGDYVKAAPAETLMQRRGNGIPNDVAALQGARLVTTVETEEGGSLDEAKMKQMTGGDRISARFMRAEWFEFTPQFKIVVATNHKPVVRGNDHGVWRRIQLVPFEVTIPEEERDRELRAKLRAELSGILDWAVAGCLAWQRDGLGTPERVTAATAAYREEMDSFGDWLRSCCLVEGEGSARRFTRTTYLYDSYRSWAEQAGERPIAQIRFAQRLRDRGLEQKRTGTERGWLGIVLRRTEPHPLGEVVNLHDSAAMPQDRRYAL